MYHDARLETLGKGDLSLQLGRSDVPHKKRPGSGRESQERVAEDEDLRDLGSG